MIPRQLSPGDNPQFAIFPPDFRLGCHCPSWSALSMNADNRQTASGYSQKSGTLEPSSPIKAELLKTPKSDQSISCEFIPELPFPWNGAFLEWQKELQDHTEDDI